MVRQLPIIGKILTLVIVICFSIILFFFTSCGSTRVVVRNGTSTSETAISVTTNNPTSVSASPNVSLDILKPYKDESRL